MRSRMLIIRPRSMTAVALTWGAVFAHAAAAPAGGAGIDQQCLADLKENGPPAWKKVATFVENVAVTCHNRRVDITGEGSSATSAVQNTDWSLCWNRPAGLRFLERRDSDSERRRIFVVNPKYRFELFKVRERDAFQMDSGSRFAPKRRPTYDLTEEQFRSLLEAGIMVYSIRLDDILSDKEFRLDRIEYIPDSKGPTKRVLIEWRYLGSEGGRTRRAGGIYSAELNPANSWQVDRAEVKIPARSDWGGWKQENTFQTTDASIPFPATVTISFTLSRAKLTVDSVQTLGKPTTCERSEAEFYLPYYGIPESALGYLGVPWWRRWLIYGASLASLCLAGFVATLWLRRRRVS
jgi:hypothetical protein